MARVRGPQIQVTFFEVIGGTGGTWDFTPFLGEGCTVTTSYSVREPAGTFTISMPDLVNSEYGDSDYFLAEPMDGIEIRMSHDDESLPLVFRGFVSEVRREEVIGADGTPSRRVIISGNSTGKILLIQRIYYEKGAEDAEHLMSTYKFLNKYGEAGSKFMSAEEFAESIINILLNPSLEILTASSALSVSFEPDVSIKGSVSPYAVNSAIDKSAYDLLAELCDVGPFNELYVEDLEDGIARIVIRPNQFYTAAGEPAHDGVAPDRITIGNDDIVGITAVRSDARVANLFWVYAPGTLMSQAISRNQMYTMVPRDIWDIRKTHENAMEKYYGYRMMQVSSRLLGPDMMNPDASKQQQGHDEVEKYGNWMSERCLSLRRQNMDNVVFESGSATFYGNERLKAGMYIDLQRHGVEYEYYAVQVTQNFAVFGNWTTTVQFERGKSFIERGAGDYAAEIDRRGAQ